MRSAPTRLALIAGFAGSLLNFRRELLETLVDLGCEVTALAPDLEGTATERELRRMGVRPLSYRLDRQGASPKADLASCLELARLLSRLQADKVLSYTLKPVIYGSIAAKVARVPEIYSLVTGLGYSFAHNPGGLHLLQRSVVALCRVALPLNSTVFFQNPDDLGLFRDKRILSPTARAVVVDGSGVNLDWFSFSPVTAPTPTFLLMSRLLRAKGVHEYATAAGVLKERYPGARFLLLGRMETGVDAVTAEDVRAWERSGAVEYMGCTTDVRPFLRDSSVLVLPSYYREGTPRCVLEALAVGRPVVTTDAPGCRETVVHGENGFLVAPRDVESLVAGMEHFILEPSLVDRMGLASRRLAESRYDVHKVNRVMLEAMGLLG